MSLGVRYSSYTLLYIKVYCCVSTMFMHLSSFHSTQYSLTEKLCFRQNNILWILSLVMNYVHQLRNAMKSPFIINFEFTRIQFWFFLIFFSHFMSELRKGLLTLSWIRPISTANPAKFYLIHISPLLHLDHCMYKHSHLSMPSGLWIILKKKLNEIFTWW